MGSDGEIFIFDDKAFVGAVVPALDELVKSGAKADWLENLIQRLIEGSFLADPSRLAGLGFSFREVCGYLDDQFAFEGRDANLRWDWDKRACSSAVCPARGVCPLHRTAPPEAAEDFSLIFEACIADQALGEGQFVGRTATPTCYLEELSAMGVGPDHELVDLLRKLEFRGFVVGYQFGGYQEGIHGWLYADEVPRLVHALSGLDLPRIEPTFAGMRALHIPGRGHQEQPGYSFDRLSLAFMYVVARLAMAESKGILWGNDVGAIGSR